MGGKTTSYLIDKRLMPDYYPQFQCRMGACRLNCCQDGWKIAFSKGDYLNMRRAAEGTEIEGLVHSSTRRHRRDEATENEYARFVTNNDGGCPIQSPEGLCRLQLTCGEGALPTVCRTFPRLERYSPQGYEEPSCSTGCEEVLNLLFQRKEGLGFIEEPLQPGEKRVAEFDFGEELAQAFGPLQELCIDILQDRRAPLGRRLILLGVVLRDLDGRLRSGETGDLADWTARQRAMAESPEALSATAGLTGNKPMFILNNFKRLILTETFSSEFMERKTWILKQFQMRKSEGTEQLQANLGYYLKAEQELADRFGDLEYFFENVLVNTAFFKKFPLSDNSEEIWKNYVSFCTIYGFFRFFTVASRPADVGELIHTMTLASRTLLHYMGISNQMTDKLFENDSATLAHMAILALG